MKHGVLLLVVSACAPKEDYTPQIDIQPEAEWRICYSCTGAPGACSPEIERTCAAMRSDTPRYPNITLLPDDASVGQME